MLTANTQFGIELRKLIDAEIDKASSDIVAGLMSELEYRRATGKIAGLRMALSLFDAAHENLEKR